MQDIIEGDNIPLRRLFAIALRTLAMLALVTLTPQTDRTDALE